MKAAVVLLIVIGVAFAASTHDDLIRFKQFIIKHNKSYTNAEFKQRFTIFQNNLRITESLNKQSKSATFGVTRFSDLSVDEFKSMYLGTKPFKANPEWPMAAPMEVTDVPDSWDWRTKGAVTAVKDQGQCGSCWSFSTTGNVEGQWFLAGHNLTALSEQNLVDCDHTCMTYQGQQVCDSGCDGGLMPNAFNYIISNGGIDTEESYPYTAADGTCQFNAANVGAKISNWTMIPGTEDQMQAWLVKQGPISIAVDATWWQFYIEGIFDFPWCGTTLDHGVLIVGYGHGKDFMDADTPYWIIKNSWAASWGEEGYIRVYRGDDQCGVEIFPCTSLINA